jgi:hypothetical protein
MNIFKKRQCKLSRRITWRVILIVCFINVLIIAAILGFVFIISMMIGDMRASYVIDGLNGKFDSMHRAVEVASRNNAAVIVRPLYRQRPHRTGAARLRAPRLFQRRMVSERNGPRQGLPRLYH